MQRAAGLALMLQGMYCTVKNVVTHSQITPRHHTRSYLLRGPLLTCPRAGGEPCTPGRTPTAGCGSAWTWGRSGRGRSGWVTSVSLLLAPGVGREIAGRLRVVAVDAAGTTPLVDSGEAASGEHAREGRGGERRDGRDHGVVRILWFPVSGLP